MHYMIFILNTLGGIQAINSHTMKSWPWKHVYNSENINTKPILENNDKENAISDHTAEVHMLVKFYLATISSVRAVSVFGGVTGLWHEVQKSGPVTFLGHISYMSTRCCPKFYICLQNVYRTMQQWSIVDFKKIRKLGLKLHDFGQGKNE